jgi:4a-hydroxytetrahydrobiopterin dehydratase
MLPSLQAALRITRKIAAIACQGGPSNEELSVYPYVRTSSHHCTADVGPGERPGRSGIAGGALWRLQLRALQYQRERQLFATTVANVQCHGEDLSLFQKQVDGWNVVEEHHITKVFNFPDFRGALRFVNRVGELAEEQGHHPDIFLAWGRVEITTWTHKISGLTESDFILAAKIDQLYKS